MAASSTLDDTPVLNPFDPAFIADPYPTYRAFRLREPVALLPLGSWFLTRQEDVAFVLRDKRFIKNYEGTVTRLYGDDAFDHPAVRNISTSMLMRNPPDHGRLRGLVTQAFTARRIEGMRPGIEATARALVDAVADRGAMDLMPDFALRLPIAVICDMLGVDAGDVDTIAGWTHEASLVLEMRPLSPEELARADAGSSALAQFFLPLIEARRAHPRDDLISALVAAEQAGDKLSTEELLSSITLLFGAGFETTTNLIGNGLLALLRHPDQLALLRARPELMANAVEEMLRYDSSVQFTGRHTAEAVTIAGVRIEAGQFVLAGLGAANRDPDFHADPERFDITRTEPRPMSFGGGIHYCLGAQLARIEGQAAFSVLLEKLPGLRFAEEAPRWRPSVTLHGLERFPIAWDD